MNETTTRARVFTKLTTENAPLLTPDDWRELTGSSTDNSDGYRTHLAPELIARLHGTEVSFLTKGSRRQAFINGEKATITEANRALSRFSEAHIQMSNGELETDAWKSNIDKARIAAHIDTIVQQRITEFEEAKKRDPLIGQHFKTTITFRGFYRGTFFTIADRTPRGYKAITDRNQREFLIQQPPQQFTRCIEATTETAPEDAPLQPDGPTHKPIFFQSDNGYIRSRAEAPEFLQPTENPEDYTIEKIEGVVFCRLFETHPEQFEEGERYTEPFSDYKRARREGKPAIALNEGWSDRHTVENARIFAQLGLPMMLELDERTNDDIIELLAAGFKTGKVFTFTDYENSDRPTKAALEILPPGAAEETTEATEATEPAEPAEGATDETSTSDEANEQSEPDEETTGSESSSRRHWRSAQGNRPRIRARYNRIRR